jgi:hypothetical protein
MQNEKIFSQGATEEAEIKRSLARAELNLKEISVNLFSSAARCKVFKIFFKL